MAGKRRLISLDDRGPLRVMFLITSMPVGGAETLLVNLIRRLDRERFRPSLCCLKELGPLGTMLATEVPAFSNLIHHKFDLGVLPRLARLLETERIDALVTVGAGDKMFWGRLAARRAGVPVVLCALHSTGWPDAIGRLNGSRLLGRWTDGFIGVASAHAQHLVERERFAADKVHLIPNGVDAARFHPGLDGSRVRKELGIGADAPVAGIVAALRPEKNHELFLRVAAQVVRRVPGAQFLAVGDGPLRGSLVELANELKISSAVHWLGTRGDVPEILAALDVFLLTSKMEANPVSILEAMAVGKPVIAPRVGSISESVVAGESGFLTQPDREGEAADRLVALFTNRELAQRMGERGRQEVLAHWSLERMVSGYEELMARIYNRKCAERQPRSTRPEGAAATAP